MPLLFQCPQIWYMYRRGGAGLGVFFVPMVTTCFVIPNRFAVEAEAYAYDSTPVRTDCRVFHAGGTPAPESAAASSAAGLHFPDRWRSRRASPDLCRTGPPGP